MITRESLISESYLAEQQWLHAAKNYGTSGHYHAATVNKIARDIGAQTVLDYGCGRSTLRESLFRKGPRAPRFLFHEYDPAITGKNALPARADLVICTDVLEHIEPDKIEAVLAHLHDLALMAAFVVISLRPAVKLLSNGSNAHILLREPAWWSDQFRKANFKGERRRGRSEKEWEALLTP